MFSFNEFVSLTLIETLVVDFLIKTIWYYLKNLIKELGNNHLALLARKNCLEIQNSDFEGLKNCTKKYFIEYQVFIPLWELCLRWYISRATWTLLFEIPAKRNTSKSQQEKYGNLDSVVTIVIHLEYRIDGGQFSFSSLQLELSLTAKYVVIKI